MIERFETRQDMATKLIKPGQVVCEIGVFMGEFARFLYSLEPSELVLIDPFDGWCSSGNQDGNNVINTYLPMVYENMRSGFAKNLNIKLERGLSWDVLETYPNEYFDFCYIDSSHSYEGTKRELLLCAKKVKRGGIIAGHDYAINHLKCQHTYEFGVQRAVAEFCAENGWEIVALAFDGCVSFALKKID